MRGLEPLLNTKETFGFDRLEEMQRPRGLGHILERNTGRAPGSFLEREERCVVGPLLEMKGMHGLGLEGAMGLAPFSKRNTRRKSVPPREVVEEAQDWFPTGAGDEKREGRARACSPPRAKDEGWACPFLELKGAMGLAPSWNGR